ncbi:MAG: hypothetical protein HKN09_13905 [Saprospiraceae bacterium]|nr:hypothetical protein [Saprospiraceae bacterium]
MRILYLFIFCSMFLACVPESKKILTEVDVRYDDPVFQKIAEHEYSKEVDSLYEYLSSPDPTYRYLAARSFASLHEPGALDSLYTMLDDTIVKVRAIAAHAIGQMRNPDSEEFLLRGFRQRDTMSVDNSANAEIIEAIGKISDLEMAKLLINAKGYRNNDTLLVEGRMKSLYAFTLRNINSPEITQFVVDAIRNPDYTDKARLYGAHYLARSSNLNIEKQKFQIAEAFAGEQNVFIKMALASALRHSNDPEIQTILLEQLNLDQDYRVKCNIIRSLKNYPYIKSIEKVLTELKSTNIHLARCACNYIKDAGIKEDAIVYRQYTRDPAVDSLVKPELFSAILDVLPYYYTKTNNATRWQIQQAFEKSSDPYIKREYLNAMGKDPESYSYLIEFAQEANDTILHTTAIEALTNILAHPEFNLTYKTYSRFHRKKILEFLLEAFVDADEGVAGAIALGIADENTGMAELIDSTQFLIEAKKRFNNPGQIETIHTIDKALGKLRGVNEPRLTKVEDASIPQWHSFEEQEIKAIIKTEKGIIEMNLLYNDAPGAVNNFITLVNDNYFDNMVFHRVVPNFVIQTGSPRGDNYGGKDYVIQSNVANAYYDDEGYVGMASAGLHTESTQWFITHSPTPHLNGRYTIFGKVTKGMRVVHNIQVGDKIQDIILTGTK